MITPASVLSWTSEAAGKLIPAHFIVFFELSQRNTDLQIFQNNYFSCSCTSGMANIRRSRLDEVWDLYKNQGSLMNLASPPYTCTFFRLVSLLPKKNSVSCGWALPSPLSTHTSAPQVQLRSTSLKLSCWSQVHLLPQREQVQQSSFALDISHPTLQSPRPLPGTCDALTSSSFSYHVS